MKTKALICLSCLFSVYSFSQVGIGNTNPQAVLDISATNTTSPANTDGILIPRIDEFPSTNPTSGQDGMMVFVSGNGTPTKGFYYWDSTLNNWLKVSTSDADIDWYETGTSTQPDDINDNIYTLGNLSIGSSSTNTNRLFIRNPIDENYSGLQITNIGDDAGGIAYGITNLSGVGDVSRFSSYYNTLTGASNATLRIVENQFNNTGTGTKTGVYNEFNYNATAGGKIGFQNRIEGGDSFVIGLWNQAPGAWSITGSLTGVQNELQAEGNGTRYGISNSISGSGTGAKYGTYNNIGSTAGGIHYGVYSDVRKSTGYAAYLIGRTSLGDATANRYIMPSADGTAGQVMTTDGIGNLTFQDVIQDTDWITSGPDIERQSGNVYIGDTNATNNDLYISNQLIDWDDSSFFINPDENSVVNSMQFNDGTSSNPKIRFSDLDSGFFSPSAATTAYTANGDEAFRIQSDGELSINKTTPSQFNFTVRGNVSNNEVRMGNWGGTSSVIEVDHDHSTGNGIYVESTSSHNSSNKSTIATYNSLANVNTDISRYESGFNSYGVKTTINSNSSGTEYGIHSDVQTADGYAAYLIGKTSLGNSTSNRYIMPSSDGTNGQVITTDGTGNLTFQDAIIDSNTQNTLNQAYDEGGSGAGRTITADNGAVAINGADGLIVTGSFLSGNVVDVSGTGTRMFFNPRKAAFRAGIVGSGGILDPTAWDNVNLGDNSFAVNVNTIASGTSSFASGLASIASGYASTAMGDGTISTGTGEMAVGSFNKSGVSRIFVVGNGISNSARSNALEVFNNGTITFNEQYTFPIADGINGQVLTTDGAGNVTFQDVSGDGDSQNTLDQAYDEGGSGSGRSINVDSGSLEFIANGTDSFATITTNSNGQSGVQINTSGDINSGTGIQRQNIELNNSINTNSSFANNYGVFSKMTVNGTVTNGTNAGFRSWFLPAGSAEGTLYGFYSSNQNGGNGTHYGLYASINNNGNGTKYGVRSRVEGSGTGTKYGLHSVVDISAGGTHYALYSIATQATGFAGYFAGRVELGHGFTDRYFLPGADGTNGQIMTTDGAGNLSFQNATIDTDDQQIDNLGLSGTILGVSLEDDGVPPVTVDLASINTDNQEIDNFSFNSSTNELTLEMEDDGQVAQTVDLSSLNPTKAMARIIMNTDQTETGSGTTKVNFNTRDFDIGNHFNLINDNYVIPTTGVYRVTAQITMSASTGTGNYAVRIRVNNIQQRRSEYNHHGNGPILRQVTSLLSLTAGDTIDVSFVRPAVGATVESDTRESFFEIEQL